MAGIKDAPTKTSIMSDTDVQWRPIVGCKEYEVSSDGQVRNVLTGMIRKPTMNGEGYLMIGLAYDNKRQAGVHIYVAEAFIPNPENKPTVNHKNLVRHDNRVENLEWATMKEQNEHKRKPEKRASTARPVWKCDKDTGERIKRYDSRMAAAQDLGLTSPEVTSIANRITIAVRGFFMLRGVKREFKQAFGFCWQLADDDLEGEIWKDVDAELLKGMEGYLASNMGRIRTPRGRITYGLKAANGYMLVDVRNPAAASCSSGDEDSSDEDAQYEYVPDEDAPDESGDDWSRRRYGVHSQPAWQACG
jgi:NUMOD4 motif/HNH endonuclease